MRADEAKPSSQLAQGERDKTTQGEAVAADQHALGLQKLLPAQRLHLLLLLHDALVAPGLGRDGALESELLLNTTRARAKQCARVPNSAGACKQCRAHEKTACGAVPELRVWCVQTREMCGAFCQCCLYVLCCSHRVMISSPYITPPPMCSCRWCGLHTGPARLLQPAACGPCAARSPYAGARPCAVVVADCAGRAPRE